MKRYLNLIEKLKGASVESLTKRKKNYSSSISAVIPYLFYFYLFADFKKFFYVMASGGLCSLLRDGTNACC